MTTTAIYARVSSGSQDTRSQETDLRAWAAQQEAAGDLVAWYRDKASGTNYDRPGWKKLEADINAGRVNRVVVWRLDRLGRTAGETIVLLDRLDKLGIPFVSIRDGFDSTTPAGRLMRNMLASFAQFETEVRQERQRAGIAAARAAGKTWGGRKVGTRITLTREKEELCQKLKQDGHTVASIARNLQLSRKTVYEALRRVPKGGRRHKQERFRSDDEAVAWVVDPARVPALPQGLLLHNCPTQFKVFIPERCYPETGMDSVEAPDWLGQKEFRVIRGLEFERITF